MKNKKLLFALQTIVGISVLFAGFLFPQTQSGRLWGGLCFGIGAAVAALGAGWLWMQIYMAEKMKQYKTQDKIETNDERNIRIKEKSGYLTMKVMHYVLLVFLVTVCLSGAPKSMIYLSVALNLVSWVLMILFANHFNKTM